MSEPNYEVIIESLASFGLELYGNANYTKAKWIKDTIDYIDKKDKQINVLRSTNKLLDEMVSEKGINALNNKITELQNELLVSKETEKGLRLAIKTIADKLDVDEPRCKWVILEITELQERVRKAEGVIKAYRDLHYNESMPKNSELCNNLEEALKDYK